MRVTLTGATGLIGPAVVAELRSGGTEVTVLSRDPARAKAKLGVEAFAWDLLREPAPAQALARRDAVVHLAGAPVAQRWTASARKAIRDSRVVGTRNLVAGLRALDDDRERPAGTGRPRVLVNSSAVGYYGAHGEEPIDEEAPAGNGFLAQVCEAWEAEAQSAAELGVRVVRVRTGVVLDKHGGALATMLPPFRLGVGGPVAGGRQYIPWVHREDLVGMILAAVGDERWSGAVNATAPEPATNRDFSRALGHALHRPAVVPVPAIALRALYGEMAQVITTGARAVPARALMLGYGFRYPHLDAALGAALG